MGEEAEPTTAYDLRLSASLERMQPPRRECKGAESLDMRVDHFFLNCGALGGGIHGS